MMARSRNESQPAAVAGKFEPSALAANIPVATSPPNLHSRTNEIADPGAGKAIGSAVSEAVDESINHGEVVVPIRSTITLSIPLSGRSGGYEASRVEVYALTEAQAAALDRLTAALRLDNARCQKRIARTRDGMVVDTPADAIRWLLDRIDEVAA